MLLVQGAPGRVLRQPSSAFLQPANRLSALRVKRIVAVRAAAEQPDDSSAPSQQGESQQPREITNMYRSEKRRKGREASLRSPYDTPLRDGNRDRLLGLLTIRAAKTLSWYLMETNLHVHHWLNNFIKENPIPLDGHWSDVSGDTFLRKLLSLPITTAKYDLGRDSLFDMGGVCDVDPRSIAQRIMEIRVQLSQEFIQDLQNIAEDNKILQLETLQASLLNTLEAVESGERMSNASPDAASSAAAGSGAATNGKAQREQQEREKQQQRSSVPRVERKKVVLPAQSAPRNWRMRAEVELEVHGVGGPETGFGGSAIPDSAVVGPAGNNNALAVPLPPPSAGTPPFPTASTAPPSASQPPASSSAPDTPPQTTQQQHQPQQTSSSSSPSFPATPGQQQQPGQPGQQGQGQQAPKPLPPLHPELAELLPQIRAQPAALSGEVAAVLATYAMSSGGRLHPEVSDALRAARNAGAVLHPEILELLPAETKIDTETKAGVQDLSQESCLHSDEE